MYIYFNEGMGETEFCYPKYLYKEKASKLNLWQNIYQFQPLTNISRNRVKLHIKSGWYNFCFLGLSFLTYEFNFLNS